MAIGSCCNLFQRKITMVPGIITPLYQDSQYTDQDSNLDPLNETCHTSVWMHNYIHHSIKQQFFITHTIFQTEIPALMDSWVTNQPSVKMLCPQKIHRNITCLSVGLSRIGQVFSVSCKIVCLWVMTNCCFISNTPSYLFMVYLTVLSVAQTVYDWMTRQVANIELERMWKEAVMT